MFYGSSQLGAQAESEPRGVQGLFMVQSRAQGIVPPSLPQPCQITQRCRQAGKALCVLISVSSVWGTKLTPQFGASRAVCRTRLPSVSPRGWPQLPYLPAPQRSPSCWGFAFKPPSCFNTLFLL